MNKKFLGLLVVFALGITLGACNGGGTDDTPPPGDPTPAETPIETPSP